MKRIKQQMLIGQQLLLKLNKGSSGLRKALIRGGAPRNWYHNREANDLDIFVEVHKGFASREYWEMKVKLALDELYKKFDKPDGEWAGVDSSRLVRLGDSYRTDVHDIYSGGDANIVSVLEGNFEGKQKVQFVIYNTEDQYRSLEDHFPTDFSKISFNYNGDIIASAEFLNCVRNRAIMYDRYDISDEYLARLHAHYPDYALVPNDSPVATAVLYR